MYSGSRIDESNKRKFANTIIKHVLGTYVVVCNITNLNEETQVMAAAATTAVSPSAANNLGEKFLSPHHHQASNYHGITALMQACLQGQINDVQKIVRQRVSIRIGFL